MLEIPRACYNSVVENKNVVGGHGGRDISYIIYRIELKNRDPVYSGQGQFNKRMGVFLVIILNFILF